MTPTHGRIPQYVGRMLAKKLSLKQGASVAVLDAPPTIDLVLPPGIRPSERGPADVVLAYVKNRAALDKQMPRATKRLAKGGSLWLAYPKAGQLGTDLNRDSLARSVREKGLEPIGQIAIDEVWSALRFRSDPALTAARKARGAFTEKPTKKRTAAKKAGAKKAATKKPATKKPAAKKLATKRPSVKASPAKKQATKRPSAKKR